ncbi:unnamed protein product [Vicia faba]|uniref:Uncharacterized protein n=1 Tax=Vicia faba TaxID=3906 RepID=A0AAV1BA61_VICFA|nr:unnamed protein product [Vicia faba]
MDKSWTVIKPKDSIDLQSVKTLRIPVDGSPLFTKLDPPEVLENYLNCMKAKGIDTSAFGYDSLMDKPHSPLKRKYDSTLKKKKKTQEQKLIILEPGVYENLAQKVPPSGSLCTLASITIRSPSDHAYHHPNTPEMRITVDYQGLQSSDYQISHVSSPPAL